MKPEDIKIKPAWRKTKNEIWAETFADLIETNVSSEEAKFSTDEAQVVPPNKSRIHHLSFWKYAIAALVALMITGTMTMYFYSVTETAVKGVRQTVLLPDGSTVHLNADSKLTYKPYLWRFSRKVILDGEAFFEVENGKRFTVQSNQNRVNVLGTSFNIFSRPEKYSVFCLTGKIEVTAGEKVTLLKPNMQLTYRERKLKIEENIDAGQVIGWTEDKFTFTGVPLIDVIDEMERQYDIRIKADTHLDYFYTGHFSKTNNPNEVLEIIGKPFGIKFSIEPK